MSGTNPGAGATATTTTPGTETPAATGTPAAGAGDTAAAAAAAAAATAAAAAADPAKAKADADAAVAAAAAAAATGNKGTETGKPAGEQPKAPDKYELTLPEGGLADQSDVDAIAALAKANAWTNDEAQAALTEHADALKAQSDRFLTDLQAHPEIGGANLEAAQLAANKALDKFLPADSVEGKALRSALTKNGYGNFAPFVLFAARIGKAMSEDRPIAGDTSAAPTKRDPVAVLYGGQ